MYFKNQVHNEIWQQGRRQDVAAAGGKNHKGGAHF